MDNYLYRAKVELLEMQEQNRLEKFRKNWEAYLGVGPKPLKVAADAADDNLRMNFSRIVVDKGVAFLFGKEVKFELTEGEQTREEEWLDAAWQVNRKMSTLQKLAVNGAVCGTAFVKIHYVPGMAFPRLIVCDPETVSVTLSADDIDDVLGYTITYSSHDPVTNKIIIVRQEIKRDGNRWIITDKRSNSEYGNFNVVNEQVWPYDFAPMVHCQNIITPNEFWGTSDIEDDLLEVINKGNFTISNILKILRYHAHPKTWASGVRSGDININPDQMIILPNAEGRLQNLEMQSDLQSSLAVFGELRQFTHELARVPEIATGKVENVGQLSGVALEILYQPLLEKTEAKRVTYGEMIVEINRRMLALAGFGEDNITTIHWQRMLPRDIGTEVTAALGKKQIGVSSDTLIQELGYNPDNEREKAKQENTTIGAELLRQFNAGQSDNGE
ncbi:MAG TPA: phage portal protein [Bellilinea sp.]|nr:phage portal protein [Bellilinea sp.]